MDESVWGQLGTGPGGPSARGLLSPKGQRVGAASELGMCWMSEYSQQMSKPELNCWPSLTPGLRCQVSKEGDLTLKELQAL